MTACLHNKATIIHSKTIRVCLPSIAIQVNTGYHVVNTGYHNLFRGTSYNNWETSYQWTVKWPLKSFKTTPNWVKDIPDMEKFTTSITSV